MADVRMVFKIDGDSSPLVRAIQGAMKSGEKTAQTGGKLAGSEFGKQFSQQVKSTVMSFLGAGAIVGAIKKQIAEATKITADAAKEGLGVEAMQELQRAAELTGMTVQELREAAPEVAEEFVRLMTAVRSAGGILDEETVRTLADAGQDLKEAAGRVAPGFAFLAKIFNLLYDIGDRAVQTVVGSGQNLVGLATGDGASRDAGKEMIYDALTRPLSTGRDRNATRAAAQNFRDQMRANQAASVQSRANLTASLTPLFRTAGGERDQAMLSMIPGGTSEMLAALRQAVNKLDSVDRTLKEGL